MRPKKNETTGSRHLFRARLDQIINMRHELAQLASKIDWDFKVREIAAMLKAIHAGEDLAAAREKAIRVIEKLRGLRLMAFWCET